VEYYVLEGEESRGAISLASLTLLRGLLEEVHEDFDHTSTMPAVTELFSMGQPWNTRSSRVRNHVVVLVLHV
jgi:hypothetical protein